MEITAALVKELRERTGAGMMDCKKALVEAQGDIDGAADYLRKAGAAKADKKSSRVAAEGRVALKSDERAGRHVLIEVNSETDFVAKDDNFATFVDELADVVLAKQPASVEALMATTVGGGRTVEDLRLELVTKVGENIAVRRFEVLESEGTVGTYLHGTRIGVLVEIDGGGADLARDLAMQVAATSPRFVSADEVPQDVIAKEREIFAAQAAAEGKSPEIVAKMVEGRLRKHLDEITLMGQPFVKDPDKRVRDLLKAAKAAVKRFRRFEVGEGIEKKVADFREEVMAQAKQSR